MMGGGVEGRRRKGTDLVRTNDVVTIAPQDDSTSLEHIYRIEVWSDAPEAGGEILETISRATDFSVSMAAFRAALRARPGKVLVHLNGRHRMGAERAQDPPPPLRYGRSGGGIGHLISSSNSGRLPGARQARAVVSARW